ncbi:SgcJ/EcaC family oxidoreductase [Streptomyces uncialis]|uniref:SgcJ/EcaC family oxidoreductase n=1 Tax=Streptomyces uncialis TaxID=1048205 RepID=UPI0009A0AD2B|nr:SgcJ/EcaC family oxidoreductase [Streptomyces uncialis]WST67618.1 SgcJ/EcaC family oxidoreductase [Streptomyces uncialis]
MTSTPQGTTTGDGPGTGSTAPEVTGVGVASGERVADIDAIQRLIADAGEHQNDVERLIALHTPDVSIVNFVGRRLLGRDSMEKVMRVAVASPLAKILTTVDVLHIRFVRADVAVVACVKHVSDERDPATVTGDDVQVHTTTGSLTYVLEKSGTPGTGWRITHAQTTPVLG